MCRMILREVRKRFSDQRLKGEGQSTGRGEVEAEAEAEVEVEVERNISGRMTHHRNNDSSNK